MPLTIANATSTSRYSDNSYNSEGSPLAQGWLIVKTAAVLANAKVGNQSVSDTLWTDQYLDPGYYPFAGSQKEGLILVEFKDAVTGTHGIVNGQFVEPGRAAFSAQSQAGSIGTASGLITGQVSSAGAKLAGTGFSSSRLALGQYRITFDTPYAAPPVLVPVLLAAFKIVYVQNRTAASVDVIVDNGGTDAAFDFIVEAVT